LTHPRKAPVQKGRKPDKLMRDALIMALMREAEDGEGIPTKKLHLIAGRLVEKAMAGDISAIKEVCDRVDGKPTQPVNDDEDLPILTRIERVLVRPQTKNS
jgi:hypothetical protein